MVIDELRVEARNRDLMSAAVEDKLRFERGEMSVRESLDFLQALLDAGLVGNFGREYAVRIDWLASQGLLRRYSRAS